MKVCVIGNSHVGALKLGWDIVKPEYPGIAMTFFAARRSMMRDLTIDMTTLVPKDDALRKVMQFTSGGLARIVPADYDVILLHGMKCRAYFQEPGTHYSVEANRAALDGHYNRTLSMRVFGQLRAITQARIHFGHNPLRARPAKNTSRPLAYIVGTKVANDIYFAPKNAVLVPQPTETIVNGSSTNPEFSLGSIRLARSAIDDPMDAEAFDRPDRNHMNDKFGALWLRDFFKIVG